MSSAGGGVGGGGGGNNGEGRRGNKGVGRGRDIQQLAELGNYTATESLFYVEITFIYQIIYYFDMFLS